MYGTEKKLEKPFAVIEKVEKTEVENHDDSIIADSQPNMSFSILDNTVNIENRTKSQVILCSMSQQCLLKPINFSGRIPRPSANKKETRVQPTTSTYN